MGWGGTPMLTIPWVLGKNQRRLRETARKNIKKGRGGYLGHAPTRRGLDLALATAYRFGAQGVRRGLSRTPNPSASPGTTPNP